MRRILSLLCLCTLTLRLWANGEVISYWFDHDLTNAEELHYGNVSTEIDVSDLSAGLHSLNVMVDGEMPSCPHVSLFYKAPTESFDGLRYWFDHDLDNAASISSNSVATTIDVNHLPPGLHTLNVIADGTTPSCPHVSLFYKATTESFDGLRYWFDHDLDNATSISSNSVVTAIDVNHLSPGLHTLNVIADGTIPSCPHVLLFYKAPTESFDAIRYWFDHDIDNATEVKGTSIISDVDVSHLSWGLHTLNVQLMADIPSCPSTCMFLRVPTTDDYAKAECYYAIDEQTEFVKAVKLGDGNFLFQADVADESIDYEKEHTIHFFLSFENGYRTAIETATFTKSFMLKDLQVILDKKEITMRVGEQAILTATLSSEEVEDKTLSWTSSDESVATVSSEGVVTAIASGECTVKVSCGDATDECQIFVTNLGICNIPAIVYDGRYVTILKGAPEDVVYYTVDGTEPTVRAAEYTEAFDVGGIITVKAIATRVDYDTSIVAEYTTPAYYDGDLTILEVPDSLYVAFGWCSSGDSIERLTVKGNVGTADIEYIRGMKNLDILELGDANIVTLADGAFAGTGMRYVQLPKSLSSVGGALFRDCRRLGAIAWTALQCQMPDCSIEGLDNPNLLLYVSVPESAPKSVTNVIVEGRADEIVLVDDEDGSFFCPEEFRADRISYSHVYTQATKIGEASGWETLTLPFDVEKIEHETKGEIRPFAAFASESYDEYRPFWLDEFGSNGFARTDRISANVPYILAMPNDPSYAEEYILAGRVTFSAENCYVPPTPRKADNEGAELSFLPVLTAVDGTDKFVLNVHDNTDGDMAGSKFVRGLHGLSPFQAYLTGTGELARKPQLRLSELISNETGGIPKAMMRDKAWQVYAYGGTLYIRTDIAQRVDIYDIDGMLIRVAELAPGLNAIRDLADGFYLVKDTKIFIR